MQLFSKMPSSAKTWIYAANRVLTSDEQSQLNTLATDFLNNWVSHQQKVVADFAIVHQLFFVLMVDENACHLGGCGTDDSVRFIKSVGSKFGVDFLNRMQTEIMLDGNIIVSTKGNTIKLYEEGKINNETPFFNKNLLHKNEFDSKFEIPFKDSWVFKSAHQLQSS